MGCSFDDGDFAKFGLMGQGLYVSPVKGLVIAFYSANKNEVDNAERLWSLSRSIALLKQFKSIH